MADDAPPKPDPPKANTGDFRDALVEELQAVAARRRTVNEDDRPENAVAPDRLKALEQARGQALRMDLVGLAFSGGGIRSATFNLGALQALASLRLLTRFDYLSTVSGGGYIGGWLAGWVWREGLSKHQANSSAVHNVERQLDTNRQEQAVAFRRHRRVEAGARRVCDEEPSPVRRLRQYSRYLAPKSGLFSVDLWTLVAIYVRNLVINAMVLLPAVAAAVLLGRLVVRLYAAPASDVWLNVAPSDAQWVRWVALAACASLVLWAFGRMTWERHYVPPRDAVRAAAESGSRRVWGLIVLPLVIGSAVGVWCFAHDPATGERSDKDIHSRLPEALRRESEALRRELANDRAPRWGLAAGLAGGLAGLHVLAVLGRYFRDKRSSAAATPAPSVPASSTEFWELYLLLLMAVNAAGVFFAVAFLDDIVHKVHGWQRWQRMMLCTSLLALALALPANVLFNGLTVAAARLSFATLCMGAVVGLLLGLVFFSFARALEVRACVTAAVGPPLVLALLALGEYVEVVVGGAALTEHEREWRSRLGACLLLCGLAWLGFFGTVIFLPWALGQLSGEWKDFGPAFNWAAVVSWVVTVVAGAWAGGQGGGARRSLPRAALAALAPPVFLVGLLALVSVLVDNLPAPREGWKAPAGEDYLFRAEETPPEWLYGWLGLSLAALGAALYFIHVNRFSLHALYANRLIRCYLGASRPSADGHWSGAPTNAGGDGRHPNEFTGLDPQDDFPLAYLRAKPPKLCQHKHPGYVGPYPLFNTALNLVGGRELAIQDRKGESFVLTPDYCGAPSTGYARLDDGADEETLMHLSLGRAMAISGAAADPNMGVNQSAAQTALLTVLNARLGWWLQNPKQATQKRPWRGAGPEFGGLLFDEARGRTDAERGFVHLSDGGHFENLGVYELIRRRCRYVVVCDVGQDTEDASENLANLLRLVRNDFGVRVEIDTAPLRKQPDGLSRWHCAVGAIRYDEVDDEAVAGTLVFIRASLTGDEPSDIRNYAVKHPPFPHHSTADQFYDEAQFESYRALGFHAVREAFADAALELATRQARTPEDSPDRLDPKEQTRALFAGVRRRWFPPPPDFGAGLSRAADQLLTFLQGQRANERLQRLSKELYPELNGLPAPGPSSADGVAELHGVDQMLLMMQTAWLNTHLEGYHGHPLSRGMMNIFRRWTASDAFHRHWPALRGEYSKDFVRFCERALNLDEFPVKAVRLDRVVRVKADGEGVLDRVGLELFREWAGDLRAVAEWVGHGVGYGESFLKDLIEKAAPAARRPPVWVLTTGRLGEDVRADPAWGEQDYPCGVVLVHKLQGDGRKLGLLFYVRGPYRTLGLGRASVRVILRHLDEEFHGLYEHLVVRYPGLDEGSAHRLQRTMWMSFFQDHDFVRHWAHGSEQRYLQLERPLAPPAPARRPADGQGKTAENLSL